MKQWCTNYKFSQNEFASRYSTQSYIYYTTCIFRISVISEPWPNPTHEKHKFSTHSRPNPTQPAGQPNPRTTLLCQRDWVADAAVQCKHALSKAVHTDRAAYTSLHSTLSLKSNRNRALAGLSSEGGVCRPPVEYRLGVCLSPVLGRWARTG